ncbi:hypothetical protein BSL78_06834 [Apostichopus japonicus]|uniref:Ig-like domain-containing protein n=1 Tax=Stichopus japonicus TaxID=307972 RepID=A0A2G8L7L3_STIJA|nr:hypothetical protein BSL78_06834 [Apostichopus japonicus]
MEHYILLFMCVSAAMYETEANDSCADAVEVVFGTNLTLLCNAPFSCSDTFWTAPPINRVVERDNCTPDNICYNVDDGKHILSIFNATTNTTGYVKCRCVQGESNRANLVHCFELIGICQMEIKTSNHQPLMYNSTRAAKNSTFDISLKEGEMVTVQCQESAALTTSCSDLNLLSTSPFSFRAMTSHHRCVIQCMVEDQCGVTMILHVGEAIAQTTPQKTTRYTTQHLKTEGIGNQPTDHQSSITNKPENTASPIAIPLIVIVILLLLMIVFGCGYYCLCRNYKALAFTKGRMKSSRIPKDGTDEYDKACRMTSRNSIRIVADGLQEEPKYFEVDESKSDVHMYENKSVIKTVKASINATLDESVEYDVVMKDKRDSKKVPSDADVTKQNES